VFGKLKFLKNRQQEYIMVEGTREQISEVLMAIYQVPGEFFIVGLVVKGIGESFLSFTEYGHILVAFGTFLIIMEFISPFIAGIKLYEKAMKNIRRIF
jgi:hypothetical protein